MYARRPARFTPEDQTTVHRWARMLTVVYSLSLVALVTFVLISHQLAGPRLQAAGGVQANLTRP
jgi:hypothetical protein